MIAAFHQLFKHFEYYYFLAFIYCKPGNSIGFVISVCIVIFIVIIWKALPIIIFCVYFATDCVCYPAWFEIGDAIKQNESELEKYENKVFISIASFDLRAVLCWKLHHNWTFSSWDMCILVLLTKYIAKEIER